MLSKLIMLWPLLFTAYTQTMDDYQMMIQPYAIHWHNECISQLSTQDLITITDTILLSFQVVHASIKMSQARLKIQSELFTIVTLSINDTFEARTQAENNDLSGIKQAVQEIQDAQESMKAASHQLTKFGPLLINIHPIVIQNFILNLKDIILNWAKTQHATIIDLEQIQQEFIAITDRFDQVKNIFATITATNETEHHQLLQGTNNLTDLYKETETVFAHLTAVRQEGINNLEQLLNAVFKIHYEILYNYLEKIEDNTIHLIATIDHKLPTPEYIFGV